MYIDIVYIVYWLMWKHSQKGDTQGNMMNNNNDYRERMLDIWDRVYIDSITNKWGPHSVTNSFMSSLSGNIQKNFTLTSGTRELQT